MPVQKGNLFDVGNSRWKIYYYPDLDTTEFLGKFTVVHCPCAYGGRYFSTPLNYFRKLIPYKNDVPSLEFRCAGCRRIYPKERHEELKFKLKLLEL